MNRIFLTPEMLDKLTGQPPRGPAPDKSAPDQPPIRSLIEQLVSKIQSNPSLAPSTTVHRRPTASFD